jgi:hypothetical protein
MRVIMGRVMSTDRDDTTRYLCAAAHLDDRFTDRVLRELLTEPTRAVPPAAGVRAGAVLAEAVAARARRKVRDVLLVVFFGLALFALTLNFLIAWLMISVLVGAVVYAVTGETPTDRARRSALAVTFAVAGETLALTIAVAVSRNDSSQNDSSFSPGGVLAIMLLAVLLTVLLVDDLVVWRHIEDRFRLGSTLQDPEPDELSPDVRPVYMFGSGSFLTQLRRHLHQRGQMLAPGPDETANGDRPLPAPVVVARGYRMFVGAGEPFRPWSLAVPLRPREDAEQVVPLTANALYERVEKAMTALRDVAHLSPGGRFARLRVNEQIVVAAEELITHLDEAGDFLAAPSESPYPLLRGQRVRELRDNPLEWARYYLRFQLETWDREFVVSAFLHLAVSDTTLYVEWTPCVLPPVNRKYRVIDVMWESPLRPVLRTAMGFLVLPLTMPARLYTACTWIHRKRWPCDRPTPARYGVQHSVRELGADEDVRNYFQLADRSRYVKMLESQLSPVLVDALQEAGYEVDKLEQQVAMVANNNVYISGGSLSGNMVAGKGNAVGPVSVTPVGARS